MRRYLADGVDSVVDIPDDEEYEDAPLPPKIVIPARPGMMQYVPPMADVQPDRVEIPAHPGMTQYVPPPASESNPLVDDEISAHGLDDPGPDQVAVTRGTVNAKAAPSDRWSQLEAAIADRPVEGNPKWYQRVASGALGGLAGWSNAAGRTRTPIDIAGTSEAILHPGYQTKFAQWQSRVAPLQAVADIEGQRVAAGQKAAETAADIAYKQAHANYMNGQGRSQPLIEVTPEMEEASGGVFKSGTKVPASTASEIARIAAGKYEKPEKTMVVSDPGLATRLGVKVGSAVPLSIYTAGINHPEKPDPAAQENVNHWVAVAENPNSTPEEKAQANAKLKRLKDNTVSTRVSITNATAPAASSEVVLKPGTEDYKVAQKLASGALTFEQMVRLHSRAKDSSIRTAILNTATDLNPNFNAALASAGYKFFSNPKIQQQMASLNNVENGIPDLLKFSDMAARSGAPILNKAIIPGGIALGGKKYSNFNTARTAFADELSGALGYGSATDMSREMGFNMTDANLSPDAFRSAVEDVILPFVQRKRASLLGPMGPYGAPVAGGNTGVAQPSALEMETQVTPYGTYQRIKGSKDVWKRK